MDKRVEQIISRGSQGFSDRMSLHTMWQDTAENFYPEMADFTRTHSLGDEFASHLTTSYPILARQELSSAIQTMLRPYGQNWFSMGLANTPEIDGEGKQWLESADEMMRNFMFMRKNGFVRATSQLDNDYCTFGNGVISIEYTQDLTGIFFRSWHLKDVIWFEDYACEIDEVHRRWKITAENLISIFGADKVHAKVKEKAKKNPNAEINCRHIVISSDKYKNRQDGKEFKTPYVSLYVDVDNHHLIEETGAKVMHYVIPRWQTIAGSQYAYSPAAVAGLPDARLLQAMSLTLLEAGEKSVNPPMIATADAVRSDVNLLPGGVTWVDYDYDERLGTALSPMNIDKSGLNFGINVREETKMMVKEAFFLNRLQLPETSGMTATEVRQRIQEYIRKALPLFKSIELEYNGAICDMVFQMLWDRGVFGRAEDLPESLQGADIEFSFKSPLIEAEGDAKAQKYMQSVELLRVAAESDPSVINLINHSEALRDVYTGSEVPEKWVTTEKEMAEIMEQQKEQQQQDEQMEIMQQAGVAAQDLGKGVKEMMGGAA